MNEIRNYSSEMRRKRRALGWLVLTLCVLLGFGIKYQQVLEQDFHWITIGLGWVALIAAVFFGNRILSCPACHQRLANIFQKTCGRCGAMLTHHPEAPPVLTGSADSQALEYVARSRRILASWSRIRVLLGRGIYLVGGLSFIGTVTALLWLGNKTAESVGISLLAGVLATGVAWLLLNQVVDNLFGILFIFFRGKCPVCQKYFNPSTSIGIGSLHMDYSIPNFCPACSAKLH